MAVAVSSPFWGALFPIFSLPRPAWAQPGPAFPPEGNGASLAPWAGAAARPGTFGSPRLSPLAGEANSAQTLLFSPLIHVLLTGKEQPWLGSHRKDKLTFKIREQLSPISGVLFTRAKNHSGTSPVTLASPSLFLSPEFGLGNVSSCREGERERNLILLGTRG